jgi:hypothetical protein
MVRGWEISLLSRTENGKLCMGLVNKEINEAFISIGSNIMDVLRYAHKCMVRIEEKRPVETAKSFEDLQILLGE